MSLGNTSKLIEESRKIVEASNDNSVLSLILEIVTKIDNRMIQMEKNMGKRLDDMKADFLAVSARVRSLEDKVTNFRKTLTECENSCQGVSNLFDQADSQIKHNTRNIIHQDTRIKKLEEKPVVQPVIQPVTESGQIKTLTADIHDLKSKVLDLQCRSMKNNLVFTGLYQSQSENCENKLRGFIRQELEIDHYIEFGNIHRFGRRGTNNARPIVARFIYHNDLQMVLQNAYKLKGSSFGISEQYPAEINNRRKNLYPIMREAKQQRRHVVLVRDRLFIDGEQYIPPEDRPVNVDNVWNSPPHLQHGQGHNSHITPGRPMKRPRQGSSPNQDGFIGRE